MGLQAALTRPEHRSVQHRSAQRAAHNSSPALGAVGAAAAGSGEPQVLPLLPRVQRR